MAHAQLPRAAEGATVSDILRTPAFAQRRWWLNTLLFGLTLLTTTAFGSVLSEDFHLGLPLQGESIVRGYVRLIHFDPALWSGLPFSLSLLAILLAHEFGHFYACRHWRVDASLPYFLPSPLLLGTFGAFIRIRSPIYTRTILFDVGASGPYAGFLTLLPFLAIGMKLSRVVPSVAARSDFTFSTPLLMRAAEYLRFGSVPPSHILLHPIAIAVWAGLIATAINLLPMGQLDGGHIVYSLFGESGHRLVATLFVVLLLVAGFYYWAWWVWAVLMFFFGRRHPLVYDSTPLPARRTLLSVGAALVFILSASIIPVANR